MASNLTLILGGARSGKSQHAENLATLTCRPVHFVPTFNPALCPEDRDMQERLTLHKERRPPEWIVHEPAHSPLIETIQTLGDSLILIDCMTLWLSGLLAANPTGRSIHRRPLRRFQPKPITHHLRLQ